MHMVDLPVHSPASLASSSCILPGVPAAMQAFMSSMVQPGGSFISLAGATGLVSFAWATVKAVTRGDAGGGENCGEQFFAFHGGLQMNEWWWGGVIERR